MKLFLNSIEFTSLKNPKYATVQYVICRVQILKYNQTIIQYFKALFKSYSIILKIFNLLFIVYIHIILL